MQITIATVTFLVGLSLIVVSIFGGGLEVKEVKIPTLPIVPRTLSFVAGCVLMGVCLWFPQYLPSGPSLAGSEKSVVLPPAGVMSPVDKIVPAIIGDKSKAPPFLGAAIKNNLITVQDVKRILRRLGKYSGPIDDDPTPAYFQAVAEFQVSQKIDADGYVGPITYAKLREAWPEYFASTGTGQPGK